MRARGRLSDRVRSPARPHAPGGDDGAGGDRADEREGFVKGGERRGGVCRSRHSRTLPTRPMPTAPPSWRRKLIVLEPWAISVFATPCIEPRLSDGRIRPRPSLPITAQDVISASEVAVPTPTIRKNDAASRTSPTLTMRLTATRSARRPAIGIVTASTRPAGSSTAPACDGGRCSASCMNTGTR